MYFLKIKINEHRFLSARSPHYFVEQKKNKNILKFSHTESFIDVKFVSQRLRRKVSNWKILDESSLSLHWYIAFQITQTDHAISLPPSTEWCWRKLDIDKLHAFLDSRSIAEFDNATPHDSPARAVDAYLVVVCDFCICHARTCSPLDARNSRLTKNCHRIKHRFQKAKKRKGSDACRELERASRDALKSLKIAIRKSQNDGWRKLCQQVDDDPWGLSYKLVIKQLVGRRPIPGLSLPGHLQNIVQGLFPCRPMVEWRIPNGSSDINEVTTGELMELSKAMPSGKAPDHDGVPTHLSRQ